jgi:hypothetical protein
MAAPSTVKNDLSYCLDYAARVRDSYKGKYLLETEEAATHRFEMLEGGSDPISPQRTCNRALFFTIRQLFEEALKRPAQRVSQGTRGIILRQRQAPTLADLVEVVRPFFEKTTFLPFPHNQYDEHVFATVQLETEESDEEEEFDHQVNGSFVLDGGEKPTCFDGVVVTDMIFKDCLEQVRKQMDEIERGIIEIRLDRASRKLVEATLADIEKEDFLLHFEERMRTRAVHNNTIPKPDSPPQVEPPSRADA